MDRTQREEGLPIPLDARVRLAHASIQAIADDKGIDLLHIKGPSVAPGLRTYSSVGSDVDVIVRPIHVGSMMRALVTAGWESQTEFSGGSAFDHAANLYHPSWGLVDVHRTYPGMDQDPAGAFETLWQRRVTTHIAGFPCQTPDLVGQSLVLLLHAARSHGPGSTHPDIAPNWTDIGEERQRAIRALAEELHAQVGLAAAIGELERYRGDPEAALWTWFEDGGSRLEEWQARLHSARGPLAKGSVLLRAMRVNTYYLQQRLGHPPSRLEVAQEFVRRVGEAGREGASAVRQHVAGPREPR